MKRQFTLFLFLFLVSSQVFAHPMLYWCENSLEVELAKKRALALQSRGQSLLANPSLGYPGEVYDVKRQFDSEIRRWKECRQKMEENGTDILGTTRVALGGSMTGNAAIAHVPKALFGLALYDVFLLLRKDSQERNSSK